MKYLFIDFETNGLKGEIEEISFILTDIDGFSYDHNHYTTYEEIYNKAFKDIYNLLSDDVLIIFWHQFMPLYLNKYYEEFFNNLKNRYLIFMNCYSLFKGCQKTRYCIKEATYELAKKEHKGNSEDDVLDLYKCFFKLKDKFKQEDI